MTAAEAKTSGMSDQAPTNRESITSSQPHWPEVQCTSKGQKNETGDEVKMASARTCERITETQERTLTLLSPDQYLQAFAATQPTARAKSKL
jgi:hypothetical protein